MFVGLLTDMDPVLNTMLNRARSIKKGHRSSYDYAIVNKLKEYNVSESDSYEILKGYGTVRVSDDNYVKMTVKNVYLGV